MKAIIAALALFSLLWQTLMANIVVFLGDVRLSHTVVDCAYNDEGVAAGKVGASGVLDGANWARNSKST